MEVTMCDKNSPNDVGFEITLSSRMTYTQVNFHVIKKNSRKKVIKSLDDFFLLQTYWFF